jgi:tape measure domain-containing protein
MAVENVRYELSLRDLMSKGLNDINSKLGGMEKKLTDAEKKGTKAIDGLGSAFKGLGSVIAGIIIGGKIRDIVLTTAKFQSLGNAIKFASDDMTQGELSMSWLSKFSKDWGLNLQGATEGFKTFQGAMIRSKFTSNEVRKMFSQVSMGALAMGLSADDAKGTFLALGQIMGKGKVQAEELRGQIGERVPGAFAIAARAMGVTTAELDKMMANGKLIAEDFLPKFAAEMEKTFSAGAVDNMNSMTSNINRMSSSWLELQVAMGESQDGIINHTIKGWSIALDWLADKFRSTAQLSRKASDDNALNILAEMENLQGKRKAELLSSGASKSTIESELMAMQGQALSNWGIKKMRLQEQLKQMEDAKIGEKGKGGMFGSKDFYRNRDDAKDGLYSRSEEYKRLTDELTSIETASKGLTGITDKQISGMYMPDAVKTAEAEKLKKQASEISGGGPKVVNINIEALIKDVTNNFGSAGTAIQNEASAFLDQLQKALATIVVDTTLIRGNG